MPALKVNSPIKEACVLRGHSIAWLVKQMGISRQFLYQVENGQRPAPKFFYEDAAAILNVRVETLLRPEPQEVGV